MQKLKKIKRNLGYSTKSKDGMPYGFSTCVVVSIRVPLMVRRYFKRPCKEMSDVIINYVSEKLKETKNAES